eukprot:CFRG1994T1
MPEIRSIVYPAAATACVAGTFGYVHAVITKQKPHITQAVQVAGSSGFLAATFFGLRALMLQNQPGHDMQASIMSGLLTGSATVGLTAPNPQVALVRILLIGTCTGIGQAAYTTFERSMIRRELRKRFPELDRQEVVKPTDYGLHTADRHPMFWSPILRGGVNDYREHLNAKLVRLVDRHTELTLELNRLKTEDFVSEK